MQPDTIIPNLYNPQSLNRFSYVRNNPIRYNDPTGHREESGYEGNQRQLDCKKYHRYCTVDGKPKSSKELLAMRKPKTEITGSPFRSTPIPTMNPTLSSFLTASPTGTMPTLAPVYVQGPTSTSTPPPTSTPTATSIPNNEFPVDVFVPSFVNWPPDFAPNADDIWDIFGGALPLINQPATSLNQIANNTINAVVNVIQGMSNAVANGGLAVNEAIGNGLNYGPVMPIFYLPANPFPAIFGLSAENN